MCVRAANRWTEGSNALCGFAKNADVVTNKALTDHKYGFDRLPVKIVI